MKIGPITICWTKNAAKAERNRIKLAEAQEACDAAQALAIDKEYYANRLLTAWLPPIINNN